MLGGCVHDRLLTVGVFYSQHKHAIDDTLASSRSDTASTETRGRNSAVHQNTSYFKSSLNIKLNLNISVDLNKEYVISATLGLSMVTI